MSDERGDSIASDLMHRIACYADSASECRMMRENPDTRLRDSIRSHAIANEQLLEIEAIVNGMCRELDLMRPVYKAAMEYRRRHDGWVPKFDAEGAHKQNALYAMLSVCRKTVEETT